MERPLGAQMSYMLKDRGVDVIFGIPGVHNVELYRGIEDAGITHILPRHEQGAGFMADGYARATGRPGVAYVITGPGLCNIMTPMGQAYSDSVPLLVISSCLERKDLKMGRGRLHEMKDQEAAAATVCDWSVTALDADAAYHWIDRALAEFDAKRPRSKHIQVPIDVLGTMAEPYPTAPLVKAAAPAVDAAQLGAVVSMLHDAKRPLFLFGGGSVAGSDAARSAVSQLGAASFCTYAGKGVIAPADPLHFGSYLARPESKEIIASADVVVVIGSELSETDLRRDTLGATGSVVRVDCDPTILTDRHRADLAIVADAKVFLEALAQEFNGHTAETTWRAEDIASARKVFHASTEKDRAGIASIVEAMRPAIPAGATIFSDMTQFAYVGKETYGLDAPGQWHHPYGFGTLGYALPAAIGAKIGLGEAPVMAIAGDYGFHYTMQELGVAVELGLSLPILVWDNAKLMEIEDSMVRGQIAPNAVVAQNPDFCALAKAFGAKAAQPKSISEMQSAIADAFKEDGPTLIHVTPAVAAH